MWNDHLFFVRKSIIVVSGRRCSDQALFVLQHVHVRSFHFSAIILIDNIEFFENIEFQFWYFYIFDYIYDSNSFYKIKISEIIEILIVRFWEVTYVKKLHTKKLNFIPNWEWPQNIMRGFTIAFIFCEEPIKLNSLFFMILWSIYEKT